MKKYLQSLYIYTARYTFRIVGIVAIIYFVFSLTMALLEYFGGFLQGDNYAAGFFSGFISMAEELVPILGWTILLSVYNSRLRTAEGHKYFCSISGGSKTFREAIIAANAAALLFGAFCTAISIMSYFMGSVDLITAPFFTFVSLAVINFFGNVKNSLIRMLMIAPFSMIAGFFAGYTVDDTQAVGSAAPYLLAISAIIYLVSLAYTLKVCEKKWGED